MWKIRPFLQSSELGLSHPLTRRQVCTHSPFGSGRGGRADSLAGEGVGESQFRQEDIQYSVVLYIIHSICTLWPRRSSTCDSTQARRQGGGRGGCSFNTSGVASTQMLFIWAIRSSSEVSSAALVLSSGSSWWWAGRE
jgi:hypothetical protein